MHKERDWEDEDGAKLVREARAQLVKTLSTDKNVQKMLQRGLYDDIAQRPFWFRIWIVQEVAVSPEVVVQCGPDEMRWEDFANAVCE